MRFRILVPAILLVAGVAVALALVLKGTSPKPRAAPGRASQGLLPGFVGTMVDGPVFNNGVSIDQQLDSMVADGVESLRVQVVWSADQPFQNFSQVPAGQRSQFQNVDGVPTRVSVLDRIVGAAAARGLSVLPVVTFTPGWDALRPGNPASAPKSMAPYGVFLSALARRYGPHGAFWTEHPRLHAVPIRMWQIWNEPDFTRYWSERPFAPSYVRLLSAARAALKSVDPGAKLVLAGLPDFSWEYLAEIYKVPGASRLFDVVAIHPFTAKASNVILILEKVRAVMDRFGDSRKPILATELSWPSSQGKAPQQFGLGTTEALQAERLDQVLPLLASNRSRLGLIGFYWYTWMGNEAPRPAPDAFDYAGLLKYVDGKVFPKPALDVFKRGALAIEGCRSKSTDAGSCL